MAREGSQILWESVIGREMGNWDSGSVKQKCTREKKTSWRRVVQKEKVKVEK